MERADFRLSDIKCRLWDRVEKDREHITEVCSNLIRIPSVNPPGDTRRISQFLEDYLKGKGVRCGSLGPDDIHISLTGEVGTGPRRLIFNGHTDVVPVGDEARWEFDPFSGVVRDGMILGRGASDMKCGVAGMAYAAGLLAEVEDGLAGTLVLSFVADEETGGNMGARWLIEKSDLTGDACLIGEPTLVNEMTIGQKGALWLRLKAKGVPAHGSLSPFVGENAIMKLVGVLSRICDVTRLRGDIPAEATRIMNDSKALARVVLGASGAEQVLDHATVNVGTIRGGDKANIVADWAEADVDIRVPIGLTTGRVLDEVSRIIDGAGGGIDYEILWRSEPNYTAPESDLVQSVAGNARLLTPGPFTPTFQWASSDARLFRSAGIPTAQYGPAVLSGIHSYNEKVAVDDVITCTKVYIGVALDFLWPSGD